MHRIPVRVVAIIAMTSAIVQSLDVGTGAAIKASAKTITGGLLQLYPNDYSRPATGVFRGNNSWWEAGAAFESLIDYWALTGDSQYNSLIQNVIATEAGQEGFRPTSQPATSGGRADQAIWALTALSATEQNFPSGNVNLLDAAKSVFDQLVAVWDNSTCGGGFGPTWDSPLMNVAFKDTFSLGTFFQLAARLAIHTRNGTYTLWADKAYEWATTTGIVNVNPRGHIVYEGTDTSTNCSSVRNVQWSANSAAFLYGSALMYNVTNLQTWVSRTQSFFSAANTSFFQNGVVYEPACNTQCTSSQRAYKALFVRWLARAPMLAPFATASIQQVLALNGKIVADSCSGGPNSTCYSGNGGLPEQMAALDSVNALLVGRPADSSSGTGGSSSVTSGGMSSPTGKSAASSIVVSILDLVMALAVSFFYTFF